MLMQFDPFREFERWPSSSRRAGGRRGRFRWTPTGAATSRSFV